MIQMVDRPNTTLILVKIRKLTFKALLYLNVAVHAQVCLGSFAWCICRCSVVHAIMFNCFQSAEINESGGSFIHNYY